MNSTHQNAGTPSLEARLAARLAGALTTGSQQLPHDITERLRFGREQALQRAVQARKQSARGSVVAGVTAGGAGLLAGFAPWWQRAASVLPLVVLVGGMLMIERWDVREQVLAAAEIDAQLLGDSLPPAAYSDPGFAEYLRNTPLP